MRHKPLPVMTDAQLRRFRARLVRRGRCLECSGGNINGYATVKLNGVYYFAHRLAYRLAKGRDPGQKLVCHTCDNPPCCNPLHLFLGTTLTNMRDKIAKGRARSNPPMGIDHCNAKLTVAKVRAIRRSKRTHRALAVIYGVSHRVIGRVKTGELWGHIKC